MRASWILLFYLAVALSAWAQPVVIIYYSDKWEITPKEKATYYRTCKFDTVKHGFVGKIEDRTIQGNLVMTGNYDKGFREGEYTFYYPSGQIQMQGSFIRDIRKGQWKYFYENGKPECDLTFTSSSFFVTSAYDRNGNKTIDNGTGFWRYEYEWYGVSGIYVVAGEFKNGKMIGDWNCVLTNGQVLYTEMYTKNGKFKKGWVSDGSKKERLTQPVDNKIMLSYKFEVTENFLYTRGTNQGHYPFLKMLPPKPGFRKLKSTRDSTYRDTIPDDEKIFFAVEQQAEFPGGMAGLKDFLRDNMKLPPEVKRKKIDGKVFVKFIVGIDGLISNIEVVKGLSPALDQEAIRLVSIFPRWIPGYQNQKAVKSQFVLPIYFRIDN
jgi:TonB family protein